MKDKNLRKILGIHGSEENLCGCDAYHPSEGFPGEIPYLHRKIKELQDRIKRIESSGRAKDRKKRHK